MVTRMMHHGIYTYVIHDYILYTYLQGALRNPSVDQECPHLMTMNSTLHQLLSVWLALGGLQLERITWQTPCDLLQKV
jgi:hypothetical protein